MTNLKLSYEIAVDIVWLSPPISQGNIGMPNLTIAEMLVITADDSVDKQVKKPTIPMMVTP